MTLSILMASRGGVARTMARLQLLADTVPDSVSFEVVFVDNGSHDGTSAALDGVEGDFVVLRNDEDEGFEAACGQAAQVARGEILIAIRDDVIVQPGWVEPLLAALEGNPAVEAVRPQVIASNEELRPGACVALRRDTVDDSLVHAHHGSDDVDDRRVGRALLDAGVRARVEPDSVVTLEPILDGASPSEPSAIVFPPLDDAAGFDALVTSLRDAHDPGPDSVQSSPLTAVLMDGSRAPAERLVAGAILSAWTSNEAVTAASRALVAKVTSDERALIASRLEPHGCSGAWERLARSGDRPSYDSLFSEGLVQRDPEYSHAKYTQVVADLQLLNDVLAASPLAGRYWMFGGMLIGWARDGDLIRGVDEDFDFVFHDADLDRFRYAITDLVRAGFLPRYKFPSVFEPASTLSLVRHGTRFDFFRAQPHGVDSYILYSYHNYVVSAGGPVRTTHSYRDQPLVPIEYLDRLWLKSQDHDLELTQEYGDWRTPDPGWSGFNSRNIIAREPWGSGVGRINPATFDLVNLAVS